MARARPNRRRRRRERTEGEGEIPMTPMIDVVFLLLVYFVMTLQPTDLFAHLNVFTPSADAATEAPKDPPSLIRIGVYPTGYTFDDLAVSSTQLESFLARLATASKTQSVLIECSVESRHGNLVAVLNMCAKFGFSNLSVVSAE